MDYIYLDNAASTIPDDDILKEFCRIAKENYANPSALHKEGLKAEHIIKESAEKIALALGVTAEEIFFTSGGTEGNNLGVLGLAYSRKRTHKHVITTFGEHPSVSEVFKRLEGCGFEVTYLKPDEGGNIGIGQVIDSLRPDTGLVAVMHVHNETGAVYDIKSISEAVKAKSEAYMFVDGVQGFGKSRLNLKNVDGYSFSGHKIHGIKGTGGLYIKKGVRVVPQILGGGQQYNIRSGTENTSGAVALSLAAEKSFETLDERMAYVSRLNLRLREGLLSLEGVYANSPENGLPYILNVSFTGVKSEVMLHTLAADNVIVSAGSACSAGKNGKSKNALNLMGFPKERYESAIRFSFSHLNTEAEVDMAVKAVEKNLVVLKRFVKR
ncbi:MAG: cysteine desulfurase [Clostridiales bacterium]|jgi:cysteine desulfurase|nr:cysteine desulfurase [Clostridiales bacterium]